MREVSKVPIPGLLSDSPGSISPEHCAIVRVLGFRGLTVHWEQPVGWVERLNVNSYQVQ